MNADVRQEVWHLLPGQFVWLRPEGDIRMPVFSNRIRARVWDHARRKSKRFATREVLHEGKILLEVKREK